jgi:hypothetical protein
VQTFTLIDSVFIRATLVIDNKLVVFWLVNLYSLLVYIEHNEDESPKEVAKNIRVAHLRFIID